MRWARLPAILVGLVLGGAGLPRISQAQPPRDGLFITVPNPIDDKAVQIIQRKVEDALGKKRAISTVVFDFNPSGLPAGTSKANPCIELAEYILNLRLGRVKPIYPPISTFAFLQNEVSRHTVLPVLACQQIIMSDALDVNRKPKAKLGDVLRDQDSPPSDTTRTAYRNIAAYMSSPDLALRFLDKNVDLRKVSDGERISFLTPEHLEEKRKKDPTIKDLGTPQVLTRGKTLFNPDEARELGLAHMSANSRAGVAGLLRLPLSSLTENWLLERPVVAHRLEVRGRLDKARVQSLRRHINDAVGARANLIILQLEGEGGDASAAAELAMDLVDLREHDNLTPLTTVAFIPGGQSIGAGTYLALACNEILMGPGAALADFDDLKGESEADLKNRLEMLRPLIERRGLSPLLFQATLTKDLALRRVRSASDPSDERIITEQDYQTDRKSKAPKWDGHEAIAPAAGHFLKINDVLAKNARVAVDTTPEVMERVENVYKHYNLDSSKVQVSRDDWLDRIAQFCKEPAVQFVLIMIGIIGLIMEMKMPGATVPGVLAAICFVLFFWSHSFVGEFTLLATLLFVLGLIFLGIEVFVLPGFGFPGIAGILLIITSMVLVTLEKMPRSEKDWVELGGTLTLFGGSIVAGLVGAFCLAYYLPSIPYANRLVLKPPPDEAAGDALGDGKGVPASMLGAMGVAVTTLRPAGKAQFGEEFLDVVAEGDYVHPGARVQIVEIEGYRIVVKEV